MGEKKQIPFAHLDYEQANPKNIKNIGKYIDNRGEKKRITDLILKGKRLENKMKKLIHFLKRLSPIHCCCCCGCCNCDSGCCKK